MSFFQRLFGTQSPQELEARLLPIIKMMTIDGRTEPNEHHALCAHLMHMGITLEHAQRIIARAQSGEIPLPTEPRHKLEVLAGAAAMMVSDGDIVVEELGYLHFLAAKMQIPLEVLWEAINRALVLGKSMNPGVDVRADFRAALANLALSVAR